jgi:hypothetical protein
MAPKLIACKVVITAPGMIPFAPKEELALQKSLCWGAISFLYFQPTAVQFTMEQLACSEIRDTKDFGALRIENSPSKPTRVWICRTNQTPAVSPKKARLQRGVRSLRITGLYAPLRAPRSRPRPGHSFVGNRVIGDKSSTESSREGRNWNLASELIFAGQ